MTVCVVAAAVTSPLSAVTCPGDRHQAAVTEPAARDRRTRRGHQVEGATRHHRVHAPVGRTTGEYMPLLAEQLVSTCPCWQDNWSVHAPVGRTTGEYMPLLAGQLVSTCPCWQDKW